MWRYLRGEMARVKWRRLDLVMFVIKIEEEVHS
jgi:hypothetical protein